MLNAAEEFKKQVFSFLSLSFLCIFFYLFILIDFFWGGGGGGPFNNNQAQSSGLNLMTFVIEIEKGRHTLPKTPENL